MSCFLWKINGGARGEQICKVGLQVIFIKYNSTPKALTQLNPVYTRAARVPPHPQAFSVIPSLLLVLVPKINLGEKKKSSSCLAQAAPEPAHCLVTWTLLPRKRNAQVCDRRSCHGATHLVLNSRQDPTLKALNTGP